MSSDSDHIYETFMELEKKRMWEKLKYEPPQHSTVSTEEILRLLRKMNKRIEDEYKDEKK